MKIHDIHHWSLEYREAVAIQDRLRRRVKIRPLSLGSIRFVAGADLAFDKHHGRLFVAVTVFSFPGLDLVEERRVVAPLVFPYIPGLLSFREIPGILACLKKIESPVDVVLCDGHGIAHPRGMGLASHLGLFIRRPTVGCAKSRLVGEHDDVGGKRGDYSRLMYDGRQVGSVLRTQDNVKPMYISPGHLVDHPSSRRITLACSTRYRLPEPTRWADRYAGEEKRRWLRSR